MVKHILSIDFDKFLTKEIVLKRENPNKITDYHKWLLQYAFHEEFFDVEIKTQEIIAVLRLLLKLDNQTRVLVADSHAKIVKMFIDMTKDFWHKDVLYHIYNIDHHHDIHYGALATEERYGCANWVHHLSLHQKLAGYTWVCNEDSELYEGEHAPANFTTTTDFEALREVKFDQVFLCKSSSWIPPHLNGEFDKFLAVVGMHFEPTFTGEPSINPLANCKNFEKDTIREIIELYKHCRS